MKDSKNAHICYYLPKVKDYNMIIDGKTVFGVPVKGLIVTYDSEKK